MLSADMPPYAIVFAKMSRSRGCSRRRGFGRGVSFGNDFAAVRMYSSLGGIISGWARIFYSARVGSPWTILAGILFLFVCCFSVYPALAWGVYGASHPSPLIFHINAVAAWIGMSLNHLMLMTWLLGMAYAWSGNSRRNALLFPIGGTLLMTIFLRALRMCITKKVEWRGTAYSHVMTADLSCGSSVSTPVDGAPGVSFRRANETEHCFGARRCCVSTPHHYSSSLEHLRRPTSLSGISNEHRAT